jgi:DNA helicase MCM9
MPSLAEVLIDSDPKRLPPDAYRHLYKQFVEKNEFQQLVDLVLLEDDRDEHHAFKVRYMDLANFDPALAFATVRYPTLLLPIFDEALQELQATLVQHAGIQRRFGRRGIAKFHVHARIVGLPPIGEFNKSCVTEIRADEVDRLVQITGTVVRTGAVRLLEVRKQYECQNPKCKYRFFVEADPEQDNLIPQPRMCPSSKIEAQNNRGSGNTSEKEGAGGYKCQSANLREVEGSKVRVDYQEIRVQDQIERVTLGSVPRSMTAVLRADLVDKVCFGYRKNTAT